MNDFDISDDNLKRPKSSKSRRKKTEDRRRRNNETVDFDTDRHDKDTHDQSTDAKPRKVTSNRRKKQYVNEGFIDDIDMKLEKKEHVKKKRNTAVPKDDYPIDYDTNQNGHDMEVGERKIEQKAKKKKKPKHMEYEPIDDHQDDPYDDLKEIERELELLGTTKVYDVDPIDNQESEVKIRRKKKRRPKSVMQENDDRSSPLNETTNNNEQPNDTGYESFNNKKDKRGRRRDENDLPEKYNKRDDQPFVVHYVSDQESPKVTRKKKRHRNRRKEESEQDHIDSSKCSPVTNSKVIKVHQRKYKNISNSDDEKNDLKVEQTKKPHKVKKKRQTNLEKSIEDFHNESEDLVDGCDANELTDNLEEIALPSERHNRKQQRDTEIQDTESLYHEKKRKKKSKGLKQERRDSSHIITEVVPFTLDSCSDSEHAEKSYFTGHVGQVKRQTVDKRAIVSESLDTNTDKRTKSNGEGSSQKGISKPVKRYAFDGESDTEDSDSVNEESDEKASEVEEPPKMPESKKDKSLPKKSKQKGAKKYPNPMVTQSSTFEKDPESSPDMAVKPPRPARKSQYAMSQNSSHSSLSVPLKGIFSIDGNSYDVEEKDDCMTWSCVSGASKVPKSRRKSFVRGMSSTGGSFKGSIASLGSAEIDELNTLFYQDILGVSIKKEKRSRSKSADSVCVGMVICTYDKKDYNRLKDRPILFQHPSEMECLKWLDMIKEKLKEFKRPHSLKVFIQPWAGIAKNSGFIYNTKIKPLFEMAEIEADAVLVSHNEHIKQEVTHLDLASVDCVVALGGDGTASRVISAILNKSQELNGVEQCQHFSPVKPPVSFGIIPTGVTNQIAHSVMGLEDQVTSAIHIILGSSLPVDVCSVFRDDQFATWSFNGHYGYFGNVLTFLHRYALLGEKKVNAAFMKALTKSKFRSYECDIQYIRASAEMDKKVCNSGCRRCNFDPNCSFGSAFSDEVLELDQLNDSQNSQGGGVVELKDRSKWLTAKGSFINVSVFSNPALSHLSPQGMSRFSHLADGCIDLALVHSVDRKQFLRFLRRHGKNKDQFDFPFVETHRCREVRVQLRLKETWNHKDYNYDEIEYEVKKSEQDGLKRTESVEVIDDLESDESDDVTMAVLDLEDTDDDDSEEEEIVEEKKSSSKKKEKDKKKSKDKEDTKSSKSGEKKKRFSFFGKKKKDKKEKDEGNEESEDENNEVMNIGGSDLDSDLEVKGGSKSSKPSPEFVHVLELDSSDEELEVEVEVPTQKKKKKKGLFHITPGPPPDGQKAYQPPDYLEMDRKYKKKQQRKKDEKKKAKAERRMKSFWNLDNELQPDGCYHFRVHQGLIRIHGAGVAMDTETDEVTMKCLGVF